MVIIKIMGGLGNQLFQYAFARALEEKKGVTEIYFETTCYEVDPYKRKYLLDKFQIKQFPKLSRKKYNFFLGGAVSYRLVRFFVPKYRKRLIELNHELETNPVKIFNQIDPTKNYYLIGYYQKEMFFKFINNKLKKELLPLNQLTKNTNQLIKKTTTTNSVSIHIRQNWNYDEKGKLLPKIKHVQPALTTNYYQQQISKVIKKTNQQKLHFFVLGDNIEWAKNNLPSIKNCQYTFLGKRNSPDYEDLFIIASCKYHISSNSSFCWWGEWLSRNKTPLLNQT